EPLRRPPSSCIGAVETSASPGSFRLVERGDPVGGMGLPTPDVSPPAGRRGIGLWSHMQWARGDGAPGGPPALAPCSSLEQERPEQTDVKLLDVAAGVVGQVEV